MLYQTIQYLKFLLKSTNQHGVHSPFVYNLVTKCFYNKTKFKAYNSLKSYKKSLLKNKTRISVIDLGPGSKKTTSKHRTIAEIAKTSGTTLKRAKLLFRLSKYFKPTNVLELGTSLGIATHAIAQANKNSHILSIEGCPNISKFSKDNLKNFKNIQIKNGDFATILPKLKNQTFDMIFFDGNHQKETTLKYFKTLLPTTHNNTIFIFDDIYWSKGMTEAWETIKKHPKVTVTINTFYWGFVFFRKEQAKEHFIIRV